MPIMFFPLYTFDKGIEDAFILNPLFFEIPNGNEPFGAEYKGQLTVFFHPK